MNPADSIQSPERRRWPRVVEEWTIVCRHGGALKEGISFTRNIGARGVMLESTEAPSPDSPIEIELYAPLDCEKRTRQHTRILGRVRWTQDIPEAFGYAGSNRFRVGVAFEQIDPQIQACLDGYVRKRLKSESVQQIVG